MIGMISNMVSNVVKTVKSPFVAKAKGKNTVKNSKCKHTKKCKCN